MSTRICPFCNWDYDEELGHWCDPDEGHNDDALGHTEPSVTTPVSGAPGADQ